MDATTIVLLTVFAIIVALGLSAVGFHALLAQARAPRVFVGQRATCAEPFVLRFDGIRDGGTAQARFRARSLTYVTGVSAGHLQHLQHLTTENTGEHLLVEVTVGSRILWSWITIRQLHEQLRATPVTLVPGIELRIDMKYAFSIGAPMSALLPLDASVAAAPPLDGLRDDPGLRDAKARAALLAQHERLKSRRDDPGLRDAKALERLAERLKRNDVYVDVSGLSDPLLYDAFLQVLSSDGDCLRVTRAVGDFWVDRTVERGTMENPDERVESLFRGNEDDVVEYLSNYVKGASK